MPKKFNSSLSIIDSLINKKFAVKIGSDRTLKYLAQKIRKISQKIPIPEFKQSLRKRILIKISREKNIKYTSISQERSFFNIFHGKKLLTSLAFGLTLAIIFNIMPWSSLNQASAVADLNILDGQVDIKIARVWKNATKKSALKKGDIIRVKNEGRAKLNFYDDSIVFLAPNTKISIEDYKKLNGGKEKTFVAIHLYSGKVQA